MDGLTILGIESSCDDTAAAVVRATRDEAKGIILSSVVEGQADLHARYGGVVPEIAARAHVAKLEEVTRKALQEAGLTMAGVDAISVTAGPGLIGGLISGVMFARGLAAGAGKPLLGINHLAGHALTPRLTDGLEFPYLMLLVSGGHCQFLAVAGPMAFRRLGGTIDDAPGEAFDKVAKILGLGQPGGPAVEAAARDGDATACQLPRPMLDRPGCDMSFSGLKTAVLRRRDEIVARNGGLPEGARADLCAGFQAAVAEVLAARAANALATFDAPPVLAVAGGVSANATIRTALDGVARRAGTLMIAPPLSLCTDNAAMIAWAGVELWQAGERGGMGLTARPRWPLDAGAPALVGGGRKGAKG